MKNILVTGGAGFIGSSLIDRLLSEGNKVSTIDNFNNFYDPKIKRNNIVEIKNNIIANKIEENMFTLYEGDFRDKKFLENIFNSEKFDYIVHLAGMAGVRPSIEQPELYYDVNVTGTLNIMEEAKKHNIDKIVFASSSSVYGNNEKVPFAEDDIVDRPISPYAATKKAGELMCHTYSHLYGMTIACLRFFTVYGPRQRPDLAINKFASLIEKGESIPFFGDGSTSRDYTYIDDIVDGIIKTIEWTSKNTGKYDVFNLGGDKTVSLNEMVETIEKHMNKKAIINMLPMQPGDVRRTCADLAHSTEILKYSPKITFDEGIKKFLNWRN
ncbi:MAG: SDR family NAD(P)-dependent oxidoreductase [Sarcina sp.]